MSRLSVLLERFRRTAGVPARAADDLEAELAPVFAALEEIEVEAKERRDRGAVEAAARLEAARATAERIAAGRRAAAEAERARVAAERREAAEAEARALLAEAEAEATRVRARGQERIAPLVDSVLAGVWRVGE